MFHKIDAAIRIRSDRNDLYAEDEVKEEDDDDDVDPSTWKDDDEAEARGTRVETGEWRAKLDTVSNREGDQLLITSSM